MFRKTHYLEGRQNCISSPIIDNLEDKKMTMEVRGSGSDAAIKHWEVWNYGDQQTLERPK